jgi:putative SOS response-associated peptidase YedK
MAKDTYSLGDIAGLGAQMLEIRCAQSAPVVRRHPETGERHLDLLKWGLLPYRTKEPVKALRPINARAETVAKSGMFRLAFEQRRCLVPADAFYEWKVVANGKQPYAIARQDEQLMAFAGLWEGFAGQTAQSRGASASSRRTPTPRWPSCMTACR